MATATTLRYRTGTVNVTQGSTTVKGTNTRWSTAGINPGANFYIDGNAYANEIKEILSDTQLELVKPYISQSANGKSYSIDINYQSTTNAALAKRIAKVMGEYELIRDGYVITINGKSAYEIAQEEGYSGTKAQWLESLKGAGDYATLLSKFAPYDYHKAGTHNAHYRGKGLTFNDVLSEDIRAGTFAGTYGGIWVDVYPGDSFSFTDVNYSYTDENGTKQNDTYSGTMRVMDLDYGYRCGDFNLITHHIVVVPDHAMFTAPMNEEATTEGGYIGSKMRTVYLKRAEAIFKACFGEDHILPYRDLLVNSVTDGVSTGRAWSDCLVELMDECMVYGSCLYDGHFPKGTAEPNRQTSNFAQFNAFRHAKYLITRREAFWLRNVVSKSTFAHVTNHSCSSHHAADNAEGVRPFAFIY